MDGVHVVSAASEGWLFCCFPRRAGYLIRLRELIVCQHGNRWQDWRHGQRLNRTESRGAFFEPGEGSRVDLRESTQFGGLKVGLRWALSGRW